MPMRPEEIEELMHNMNQQKVVVTIDEESENVTTRYRSCPDPGP
jgi:hypothetical protein